MMVVVMVCYGDEGVAVARWVDGGGGGGLTGGCHKHRQFPAVCVWMQKLYGALSGQSVLSSCALVCFVARARPVFPTCARRGTEA